MRIFQIFFIALLSSLLVIGCSSHSDDVIIGIEDLPARQFQKRIDQKGSEALAFAKRNNYNTDFAILVDMSIHSGKYRMFVYNFDNGQIEHQSLCAHGIGTPDSQSSAEVPRFSNVSGSFLSSLGKYRLGARAYSNWGINVHYKMHGLESTNDNAFDRIIVLHSYSYVPSSEIYPRHLPLGYSQGCPVTDDDTMTYLDSKLQASEKPVLLWIYE